MCVVCYYILIRINIFLLKKKLISSLLICSTDLSIGYLLIILLLNIQFSVLIRIYFVLCKDTEKRRHSFWSFPKSRLVLPHLPFQSLTSDIACPQLVSFNFSLVWSSSVFCQKPLVTLVSLIFPYSIRPLETYYYYLFIYLFLAALGLCCCMQASSLVAVSMGYTLLPCVGFSLRWLLLLHSMGSRCLGFSSAARGLSSCGAQA